MSANTFVDTNILLYARDTSEPEKQRLAAERLDALWEARTGRLSVQVLSEYFVNATAKLNPGLSREEAWDDIEALSVWDPLPIDLPLIQRSYAIQGRYGLSWWDSLIVAAAEATDCTRLLSEDLSHGVEYLGIVVENPFEVG